jgi:hypothetical protein
MMTRYSMPGDWADHIRPRPTPAQLAAFDRLRLADLLLTDEGEPTENLKAWCRGVAK